MPNPTVPSNVPRPNQLPSNAGPASSNGQPRIKQEPNIEPQQFNGMTPSYTNNIARERAAQQLQQRFGHEANAQINRLQQQSAMNMAPQYPAGQPQAGLQRPPIGGQYSQPTPTQMNDKQRPDVTDHQRHTASSQETKSVLSQKTDKERAEAAENQRNPATSQVPPKPQAQPQPPSGPTNARTDGADDWEEFVAHRRLEAARASDDIFANDETLRQHVQRQAKSIEGGGLMLPLSEQPNQPPAKKCRVVTPTLESSRSLPAAPGANDPSNAEHLSKVPQLDGHDDDDEDEKKGIKDELFDEDDEDAINSDLDDPDDAAIEEEEDDSRPNQIMLCTYDKVQRVKNKWKCVLKDGVLNTGGKE